MKRVLSNNVFDNYERSGTLSDRAFYFVLGVMIIIGLMGMGFSANYAIENHFTFSTWQFWIIGLGVPLLGIYISVKSDNPVFSFIGYMMVVLPDGLILGPLLEKFDPQVVTRAAWLTAGITGLMTTASFIKPSLFENIGGALFVGLLCLLVMRILQIFVPSLQDLKWIDYLSAGLFSLYIGYDMYRAQEADRTVDSAIDLSVALYLDIINLFLSVLSSADDD